MSDQEPRIEEYQERSRLAELAAFHWEEFKSFGPKDYVASYSVITGGIDVIRGNSDPLRVVKGIGKIAFGIIVGSTGKRG